METNKKRKILWAELIIISVILLAILLPQLIGTVNTSSGKRGSVSYFNTLEGKTFTTIVGSVYEHELKKLYDSPKLMYVVTHSDMALAVSQGKADALLIEKSGADILLNEYTDLCAIPEPVGKASNCFVFQKDKFGAELCEKFNAFLSEAETSGLLAEINSRWLDSDTVPARAEPCQSDGKSGKIEVVTCYDWYPLAFETDKGPAGLFIDLLFRFCEKFGYEPVVTNNDTTNSVAGFEGGKFDMFAYGVTYTDERAERMLFSNEIVSEYEYILVRRSDFQKAFGFKSDIDLTQDGINISVLSGTDDANYLLKTYTNANVLQFSALADVLAAVENGNADYGISYYDVLSETSTDFTLYYPYFHAYECGFGFQKNEEGQGHCDRFNAMLAEMKKSGEYAVLEKKWKNGDASSLLTPERNYTGENGKFRIFVSGTWYPYSFYCGADITGLFVELCETYCEKYGYTPEFSVTTFDAGLMGLIGGTYDVIADAVVRTEERQQTVIVSDTMLTSFSHLFANTVADDGEKVSKFSSFFGGIAESFNKNFIKENRWKMIVSGLLVTIFITVLTAIAGTLLGAGICALRMSKNPFATGFARIYVKVVQGTPIVVLLLILYYIVFAKSSISATVVAVIGFSLDFAAYVSEIFRTGIETVPDGQMKAAAALGFRPARAFFKVVLPQALRQILPVYRGQFIAMVKTTSVAGYIAVQDLTKVSDIIRSRTYEAFFPLITTAVIYFAIAELLAVVLKLVESKQDPMKRDRIPKGVKKNVTEG